LCPDLQKVGLQHPWLVDWEKVVARFQRVKEAAFMRVVSHGELYYQQSLYFVEKDRRIRVYGIDITEQKLAEEERERLMREQMDALSKIKMLSGMLPICSSCKKVRNDEGYWEQIEAYIRDHSEAEFSHSICPECAARLYPEYYKKEEKK
jgi:hypothetical protein